MKKTAIIVVVALVCLLAASQYAASAEKPQVPGGTSTLQRPQPPTGIAAQIGPKAKFYKLRVSELKINGQKADQFISIPVELDQPITFTCTREQLMPPIDQITDADVKYWGSGGKSYQVEMTCQWDALTWPILKGGKSVGRDQLPKFTLQTLQFVNRPNITSSFTFIISSTEPSYQGAVLDGKFMFCCAVDTLNEIPEVDEYLEHGGCAHVHLGKKLSVPTGAAGTAVQVAKPDVIIKEFRLEPPKPVAGMPFDLVIVIWNRGGGASPAGQQSMLEAVTVVSGGPPPADLWTGHTWMLPSIPGNGTYNITLTGLKGSEGSYNVRFKLWPDPAINFKDFAFTIQPGLKTGDMPRVPMQQKK